MKKITVFLITCLILISSALNVYAEVQYTEESTGGKTIYVAGNPDMYPIEYYDSDTETYKGILPDLYAEISESTGLDFTYIRSSNKNEQNRLAKNRQAEIISAHYKGEIDKLSDSVKLLSLEKNGKTVDVCIGFTDIANASVISSVKQAVERKTDSELLALALRTSAQPLKNAEIRWFIIVILVLLVIIAVLVVLEVKHRLNTRKKMQYTLIDPLTGIGNYSFFEQNFYHYNTPNTYSLYYIIFISLSLQRIERFYDTSEIEELERYAAKTLSSFAEKSDVVTHIRNGEFLCAFQSPSKEKMGVKATELINKLNAYKENILNEHHTQLCAGIFPFNEANIPLETAFLNARRAYAFADKNKLLYSFATPEFLNKEATKVKLQKRLADAIKNSEFKLYMQFIVDAESGVIKGAEALSRWHDIEYGILSPSNYIDDLLNSGIIEHLDFYIFEEVCRQLEKWSKTDKKHLWISCNFTRTTVSQNLFFKRFEEIANKYSFNRDNLVAELTEDSLAENNGAAYQNVLAIRKLGFKVALDDLGSGYSSLRDLCEYPIDMIKIDRHLVVKSVTPQGNALLCGITKMAHDLGIKVLCEGVETEEENINSKNAHCDFIQGFYYSHVLPQEETEAFYLKYKGRYSFPS